MLGDRLPPRLDLRAEHALLLLARRRLILRRLRRPGGELQARDLELEDVVDARERERDVAGAVAEEADDVRLRVRAGGVRAQRDVQLAEERRVDEHLQELGQGEHTAAPVSLTPRKHTVHTHCVPSPATTGPVSFPQTLHLTHTLISSPTS
jgi:hypothetical protein